MLASGASGCSFPSMQESHAPSGRRPLLSNPGSLVDDLTARRVPLALRLRKPDRTWRCRLGSRSRCIVTAPWRLRGVLAEIQAPGLELLEVRCERRGR